MLKNEAIVPIHVVQSLSPDTILLDEDVMRKQGIPQAQHISLQFGIYKQTIKVLPAAKKTALTMHSRLAQQLSIPLMKSDLSLAVLYDKKQSKIKLGPLLAVMINKETPEDVEKPFGSISSFCRELTVACHSKGAFVYFFTPEAISNQNTLISGWIYDQQWRKQLLPLAEVIYNRLPSRKAENQKIVQTFINETTRYYDISFFNERFLDKQEVFELLNKDESVANYLPDSQLLTSFNQLQQMLNIYPIVYLKPIHGSLGRGIYRITNTQLNGYRLDQANKSAAVIRSNTYSQLKSLYNSIRSKLSKRKFQLQQGLSLIQVGSRPVDFRALVQKNGLGHWSITSIVARTAGNEQFVSNVARGGSINSVLNILPKSNLLQHINHESIYEQLKKAAIKIAEVIDEQLDEHFAEFGIDLAVDIQGHIWLIEVNVKPSKIDSTSTNRTKIRPSVRMLLAYAKHLTGFQEGRLKHGSANIRNPRRKN